MSPITFDADFIRNCIQKAKNIPHDSSKQDDETTSSPAQTEDEYDSLEDYLDNSYLNTDEEDTHFCPSLSSDCTDDSHSEDESQNTDDLFFAQMDDTDDDENCTVFSHSTSATGNTDSSDATTNICDTLPKTFLQLTGITVANFNMGCNFRVEKAISIMIQYEITILAIQEHSPWSRNLSDSEITSIERHCDQWGFFVKISELQIVIFDKQILACHRDTTIHESGRVIKCRFEIAKDQHVTFVPVYGVAHSFSAQNQTSSTPTEENTRLETMTKVKMQVEKIIDAASATSDLIYVFGDLQDTPDQSKTFHYGPCRLPKHPLGIVNTCEAKGLVCTIYQHLHTLDKPVISRHGSKGGRFIDSMFASPEGISNVLGIHIIKDAGVHSDHDLIINKIDLGLKKFQVSKEKEERFNFQKIMNIPVHIKQGNNHPSLNNSVFKGADFKLQEQLYLDLQSIVTDPTHLFLPKLEEIKMQLESYEHSIIERTKSSITPEDQANGKLIPRTQEDATFINETSQSFFTLLNDICREANLASIVPIVKPPLKQTMKKDVTSEKVIPGICSLAITKQIDDTMKRARSIKQRLDILISDITTQQRTPTGHFNKKNTTSKMFLSLKRFLKQQVPFLESVIATNHICQRVRDDRRKHIEAIEISRNKKIFDSQNEYQATVIDTQGRQEYETFIHEMKTDILGINRVKRFDPNNDPNTPSHIRLQGQADQWDKMLAKLPTESRALITSPQIQKWLRLASHAKRKINQMLCTLSAIRREDFENAKIHYIRLGKYGSIARMFNPKPRTGPTAGSFYPSKPGEPIRRALNDHERMEACIQTHEIWMDNPPGQQNCHFLDLESDDVGPTTVKISPDKVFNEEAQWKYLEGCLHEKVGQETSDRIHAAHARLPEIFKHIQTDSKIMYPFKYDCCTGEYLYQDLENNLRKNVAKGNGKARNTGFAIPVLGRLPKAFLDVYLLKCKLQMALRLLDIGTECSLRICIGKPCGGVRPLTVGHDDNVFLNGLAQQAIQKEIARLGIMPETLCSYQKGKGCSDATILDSVIKETALQNNKFFFAELDDDAEKMFDRLHLELQLVLLLLAGAGNQGFAEWQSANMCNRTNRLVTDIFIALLKYKCGLPQGSGFSVEIANLYAMFLLMWWNMDPIDPHGTIVPFETPRHGFPLIAGGIVKSIASLAYVDDAKRYIAMDKSLHSLDEFYTIVQGYCDLLADLSLGIKMGRNVRKCTIYLYNIPEHAEVPNFTSTAWSFEAGGPVKGSIAVVVMRRDDAGHLLCYDISPNLRNDAPQPVKDILNSRKYLGVYNNAQLDNTEGKEKILKKLSQRIGLIASKSQTVQETKISHNMLVCQVATFSPICIYMSLSDCSKVDKQLLKAYQYRLKYLPCDSKHNIFLSEKMGGIGVRCFTQEYVGALLRDIEVYISNKDSLPAHALINSLEEATKKHLWHLHQDSRIPENTEAFSQIDQISISGKKTLTYLTDWESPSYTTISHDHTHLMEKAIDTTSKYGFMLRDLNSEFCSRFADELLIQDKNAKALGSPKITTRAKLSAYIGEGNTHFLKYSAVGHVYLLLKIILDEVCTEIRQSESTFTDSLANAAICNKLSRRETYDKFKMFPGEISSLKLAATARSAIDKFQTDYRACSFLNLAEWRSYKDAALASFIQCPRASDYRIIVNEENVFTPHIANTMSQNSENLSDHLTSILRLQQTPASSVPLSPMENYPLSDIEIIEYATQHDLPIFASIDGSLTDNGIATVSVSILAPDIRTFDTNTEWQDRVAKILLTRSWQLPKQWGTGRTCINMAEALGFIIGEYTIPQDLPVIYITDSNNARTLQRNVKNKDNFTHRQVIRSVKQGIDQSIANHLEFLTSKWISEEQLSHSTRRLYAKGEEICKFWANNNLLPCCNQGRHDTESHADNADNTDCSSQPSKYSWMDDSASSDSGLDAHKAADIIPNGKTRYRFDPDMYDLLGRIIVIKVFSHQLNADFTIKNPDRDPKPNLFVVSGNQIADNAAAQAQRVNQRSGTYIETITYPPFSPRWSFTFEGQIANKGAAKVLKSKLDEELFLRKQHRGKQGLYHRLFYFNGLKPNLIGDETLLRNIIKQTADCWTRRLYCHPPLVKRVYDQWWLSQTDTFKQENPEKEHLDLKNWKKTFYIREQIIKRCPFCPPFKNIDDIRSGNLEHLHIYCKNPHLVKVRSFCNGKIETAIHALYDYVSIREKNIPFAANPRTSTLHEKMEKTALEVEKQERPILKDGQIVLEARTVNKAILLKNALQFAIITQQVPPEKLLESQQFPLSFRLGFIHSLPDKDLDLDSATITDVGYTGLFPKPLLQNLYQYAREIKNAGEDDTTFMDLINNLSTAFTYRPITVQKIIHTLLADVISVLKKLEKEQQQNTLSAPLVSSLNNSSDTGQNKGNADTMTVNKRATNKLCYATKCRLLVAKGILRTPMSCASNRNMCSGCLNETLRHRKMERLENEILEDTSPNDCFHPLLECLKQPVSLRIFRAAMKHLPTMAIQRRDDHIFGAARFLANSLGVAILEASNTDSVDPPLTSPQRNEIWRQSKFLCRCAPTFRSQNDIGKRAFCVACSFLVAHEDSEVSDNICRGCNTNERWNDTAHPCLSCQIATIIYRNPFLKRFNEHLDYWLNLDDTSNDSINDSQPQQASHIKSPKTPQPSTQDMLRRRTLSIERNFQTIKSRGSAEQTRCVFENLSILQQDIHSNCSNLKRDFDSQTSTSLASEITNDTLSPRKKNSLNRQLFDDQSSTMKSNPRPPLRPIDMNSIRSNVSEISQDKECTKTSSKGWKTTKQERTLRKKAQRKLGCC